MLSPRSPAGRTQRREEQGCVLKRAGRGRSSPCRRGGDIDAAPLYPSLPPSLLLRGSVPAAASTAPSRAQAGTRQAAALQGRGWAGRARCPRCLRGGRGRTEAGGAGAARRTAASPPYPTLHYSTHQAAAPPGPPPAVPAHDWLLPRRRRALRFFHGPAELSLSAGCGGAVAARARLRRSPEAALTGRRAEALRAAAAAPGPEQPGCAEPGLARPGSARGSAAALSPARPGPEQPGCAESGPARSSPAAPSPARPEEEAEVLTIFPWHLTFLKRRTFQPLDGREIRSLFQDSYVVHQCC
ncbi:zinc finger protein ZFPM1-like [Agelaius tricolor]|uniref:zinc finger protein ZFPM1-like n=1 Tax=Agelaius tricolor TaxID=9191 RepID=UPI0039F1C0CB